MTVLTDVRVEEYLHPPLEHTFDSEGVRSEVHRG